MANVWKVGTRWDELGAPSASVLSIMRRNNMAIVWLEEADRSKFLDKNNGVKKVIILVLQMVIRLLQLEKPQGMPIIYAISIIFTSHQTIMNTSH